MSCFGAALLWSAGTLPIRKARAASDDRIANLAAALAEGAAAELARIEAVLLTSAAALEPAPPGRATAPTTLPSFASMDRVVRAAAITLEVTVAALDSRLGQLVNSAVPTGTPLPASAAGEVAADALDTMRPVVDLIASPAPTLAFAVPVRSPAGRPVAVLVASLPLDVLAARLALILERSSAASMPASVRLVSAPVEGGPATTLAWIRTGVEPPRLDLSDAPRASIEVPPPMNGAGADGRPLLLAAQRLPRVPRLAVVVVTARPSASTPSAMPAPDPAVGNAAVLSVIGLGATALGLIAGTALARRGSARRIAAASPAELEARRALAELRAVCNTVPVGLALLDADGRLLSANSRLGAFAGLPAEALPGRLAADVLPPPLAEGILAAHAQVLREGRPVVDVPITAEAPGMLRHPRHLLLSCGPVRDAAGRIEAVSATVQDVTERARAEASRDLLVNELNHRVKNCLATVQTIAQQTLRYAGGDPPVFERSFGERVRALARAHDLLTVNAWQEADLLSVLRAALAPWVQDPRLVFQDGPEVLLRPSQAQALVLAFHELATNAAKYGALTRAEGRITIGWRVDTAGEVQLGWTETGGPPVPPRPARRGFGTRLLEQALRHDLGSGASSEIVFDPLGVRVVIRFRPGVMIVQGLPVQSLSAPAGRDATRA
jgi:PAS domain S-box-containing protein